MKEVRLASLPGYEDWSRPLREEHPEVFVFLDSTTVLISPEEEGGSHRQLFQELYEEHLEDLGEADWEEA